MSHNQELDVAEAGPNSGTSLFELGLNYPQMRRLEKRIIASVMDVPSGCRLWTGYKNQHGYGRILVSCDGRKRLLAVHRIAYELWKDNIEAGKVVMHSCDEPACLNPSHLILGTQADNMADMVAKGRHVPPGLSGAKLDIWEREHADD